MGKSAHYLVTGRRFGFVPYTNSFREYEWRPVSSSFFLWRKDMSPSRDEKVPLEYMMIDESFYPKPR